jgi:hypothetical protein
MKCKKYSYILVFILMLLIGINGVDAKVNNTCYYFSADKYKEAKFVLDIMDSEKGNGSAKGSGKKSYATVYVQNLDGVLDNDTEPILNWFNNVTVDGTGIKMEEIYKNRKQAKEAEECPTYLIIDYSKGRWFFSTPYEVYATDSGTLAKKVVDTVNGFGKKNREAWYLTNTNDDGSQITREQYYGSFEVGDSSSIYDIEEFCETDPETGKVKDEEKCVKLRCDSLFGDKKDDGEENDINKDGNASIAYLVDSVLKYVRIIVPILIILLGTLDLSKAVIAGKEDEMRKAQTTFIQRLLLGVAVFFVPLVVNVVMQFADIVWEETGYASCEFR